MRYKKISEKLIAMFEEDQNVIKWDPIITKQIVISNTINLKKIIEKIGWPSEDKVGVRGESSAWLIAQHSDHDVKFQKKCL